MNGDIKKIRILACIGLACVLFECIVGVGALFSGMMYRGFEKDKAVLKLELIKASDKELYERITGDKDSLRKPISTHSSNSVGNLSWLRAASSF